MSPSERKTILFTLTYNGGQYPIRVSRNEYYSLMGLVSDHLGIPGFGICCGMGSCGTCMVTICSRNGEGPAYLLSCGISVNDELANTEIIISEGPY